MENICSKTSWSQTMLKRQLGYPKRNDPIFIWGSLGIGKFDINCPNKLKTKWKNDAYLIDISLLWEPTDIKGMPYYAANDNIMKWASSQNCPDAKMAKKYKIVFFLDEMNLAAPQYRRSLTNLFKQKGWYIYVTDNVLIVAPVTEKQIKV